MTHDKEIVNKLKTNKGILFLLSVYIDDIAYITQSYHQYVFEDEKPNGFINSENNEFIYIKRREFNKFLSFMVNDKLQVKNWIDDFILVNKKIVTQSHKFGKSTLFLKIDKRLIPKLKNITYACKVLNIAEDDMTRFNEYITSNINKYLELSRKK